MSPKKKIKTIVVPNDDKEVKVIVDKSIKKENLRKSLENNEKNLDKNSDKISTKAEEVLSDSSDNCEEKDFNCFEFRNKPEINDNYFMAQSLRSKTSKNSFSKVMENFDLNEPQIKQIIDNQLVDERNHLRNNYIKDNYFDKWMHSLKY
jgi:predicted metal-dependent hydrolase